PQRAAANCPSRMTLRSTASATASRTCCLDIGARSYGSIASILRNGLDRAYAPEPVPDIPPIRFGNPGFAVLAAMQREGWGDLFLRMLEGATDFPTTPGWSVATVLTVPPFPAVDADATPADDVPLFFLRQPEAADLRFHHLVDVRRDAEGQLLVRRRSGHAMIVTGTGLTVGDAQHAAAKRARNVVAPELRWRGDIGDRFLRGERERLIELGWLSEA
ncbi:hypothetical protein, partial [Falsiroseomonas sp. E2-1-a20]|uniref:hypothetical protein n=1 Tax=Falsiroseomonas sp. E2-1-a20 TaxID=3239300 RepID=UPI003F3769EB